MLRVERDGAQTLVRINYSSLSVLQTCNRKALYDLRERWQPKAVRAPLVYGNAMHKALEAFYLLPREMRGMPGDFDDVSQLLAHGHLPDSAAPIYGPVRAFVQAAQPLQSLPDTDARSVASGVWVLGHYFRTYENDVYVIHVDHDGPVVERQFRMQLCEDKAVRIELFGQIDFVLRNEATGELLPGDHKTSSQMGKDFFNRIKPNHQYTGYLMGAQFALGLSGENFMVNGIQSKAKPITARGGPPTFTRQITRRTQEDFAEFRDVVKNAVAQYLRNEESGVWPLGSADACGMWSGCQYLDVCSAPNELRQNILSAKFEKSHGT